MELHCGHKVCFKKKFQPRNNFETEKEMQLKNNLRDFKQTNKKV